MTFSLYTDYPWWFSVFCSIAGAVYAFVLYRREKRFDETPKWVIRILPVFRFITVSLLAFFLLSPFLKNIFSTVEKPIIIFAQDNSESIIANKDSVYYKTEYLKNISGLISSLSDKYNANTYFFGDKITPGFPGNADFSEKQTDIASLFDEIETRFSNRNVGAVIIASDGLYNKGQNPVYKSSENKFPVYTIALGDTSIKKDVVLSKVLHNRIAYLGNKFPMEIQVFAKQLDGNTVTCTVSKGDNVLFSQKIFISGNNFFISVPVQLEAKETGLQRYIVKISRVEGESSYSNNIKDVFIDVLDSKQKILILADAPHPDISAIENSLENNDNYEVTTMLDENTGQIGNLSSYNLVILHQLPSVKNKIEKVIAEINKIKIPVLFILGNQVSVSAFNTAQNDLSISSSAGKMNDAVPVLSKGFSLFTVSDALRNFSSKFSPLQCIFGNYKVNPSVSVFFEQKIGSVETRQPLWFFTQSGERKTGFIAGEGIWRWRLSDFAEHNNADIFNELIDKTIQYLSVKADKSLFRIISKNLFYENEPVEFDAQLYNDSYELINEPEVNITITNSDGKKFPFSFGKTANAYHLNAGNFPVGTYRYESRIPWMKTGNKVITEKGEFNVAALQIETTNTIADHGLLYQIAKNSGGELIFPDQLNKLAELLNSRDDIKPVLRTEKKLSDLINLKWICFLLLFLLSLEWFIRKINGRY